MDKSSRFKYMQQIKMEWANDINDSNDLEFLKNQSKHYLKILNELNNLTIKENEENNLKKDNQKEDLLINDEDIYILKRQLYGGEGIRPKSNNSVFVPESVIRNLCLNHGDSFKYIKDGIARGRDLFENVTGISHDESIEPNEIISYEYAIVEYDDSLNGYISRKAYDDNQLVRIEKGLIHNNDVERFKIKDGDIVSIARIKDRPTYRVRWLYDSQEYGKIIKPKKSSHYKENRSINSNDKYNEDNDFKNLTISIFGGDTFINSYIEEIEKRGGNVLYTDSDIHSRIETLVSQSDIAVIPIEHTSHAKAKSAKEVAKKLKKPYVILNNNGRTYFINEIKQALKDNNMSNEV